MAADYRIHAVLGEALADVVDMVLQGRIVISAGLPAYFLSSLCPVLISCDSDMVTELGLPVTGLVAQWVSASAHSTAPARVSNGNGMRLF